MSLIDLDTVADARQVTVVRLIVGGLGAAKCLQLAAEMSLVHLLATDLDAPTLVVALLLGLNGVGSVAVALGRRTREAAIVVVVTSLLLIARVPDANSHHFYLATVLFALVAMWDDGAVAAPRGWSVPGWPLVLFRVQLTIVYGFTALAKTNTDFLGGLESYLLLRISVAHPVLPFGLARSGPFLAATAFLLVALEVGLAVAVWSDRWRPLAFAVAVPLHVGMTFFAAPTWLTVVAITIFTLATFLLYFAFVAVPVGGRRLVWDAAEPARARTARRLARLDPFGLGTVVAAEPGAPRPPDAAWALASPDGTVALGWRAVQGHLGASPLTFLVAPWLGFPLIRPWAIRAYGASTPTPHRAAAEPAAVPPGT